MELAEVTPVLKMARDILSTDSSAQGLLAVQHYFSQTGREFVADFFKRLKNLAAEDRPIVLEALASGQVASKIWLIEELQRHVRLDQQTLFVLGGWVGLLPLALLWTRPELKAVRTIDIDPKATTLALHLNKWSYLNSKNFLAATADMYELDYRELSFHPHDWQQGTRETPDILINTSCEHLTDFKRWLTAIPAGKTLVLQSNDFFSCAGHVNCVASLQEFREQAALSEVLYAGELKLPDYTRFMLIGIK